MKILLTFTVVLFVGCSTFRDSVIGAYEVQSGESELTGLCYIFHQNGTVSTIRFDADTNVISDGGGEIHKWKTAGSEVWILNVDVGLFGENIRHVVLKKKNNGRMFVVSLDGEEGKGKEENPERVILQKIKDPKKIKQIEALFLTVKPEALQALRIETEKKMREEELEAERRKAAVEAKKEKNEKDLLKLSVVGKYEGKLSGKKNISIIFHENGRVEFWEENVKFTKGEPHNWEVDLPDVIKTPFYVFSISKNGDLVFSAVIKDNKLKRLSSDITLKKVK